MFGIIRTENLEICGSIISKGVARLYYETGFPLAASRKIADEKGLRISWLNVADQFLKQGFSGNRVLSEFRELNSFYPNTVDLNEIEKFCCADYEAQREMLCQFWQQNAPVWAALTEKKTSD